MSEASLAALTGASLERPTFAVLRLRPGADPASVAADLRAILPAAATAATLPELMRMEQDFWSDTTPIGFVFSFGVLVGFLICGVSILGALGQMLDENMAEYAVLNSMGYPPAFFLLLVLALALLMTLSAVPVAAFLSLGLYAVIAAATGLEMVLRPNRVLLVALGAAATAALSALLARRRLSRADPAALLG